MRWNTRLYDVLGEGANIFDVQAVQEYIEDLGLKIVWPEEAEDLAQKASLGDLPVAYWEPDRLQEYADDSIVVAGSGLFWELALTALNAIGEKTIVAIREGDECGLLGPDDIEQIESTCGSPYDIVREAIQLMAGRVVLGPELLQIALDDIRQCALEASDDPYKGLIITYQWWAHNFCLFSRINSEAEARELADLVFLNWWEE